jgi:hypothetical protein
LDECPIDHPFVVEDRFVATLEGVGTQIEKLWHTQIAELALPHAYSLVVLLKKDRLPFIEANGDELAIVSPVDLARRFFDLAP